MCLDLNQYLHFSSHISSKRGPQLKSVTNIVISITGNEASKKALKKTFIKGLESKESQK